MLVYEYAVIRFVPRVEREEFINIGLLLFCKSKRQLLSRVLLDQNRITCFSSEIEPLELQKYAEAFEAVALGRTCENPIATLAVDERFRWLTAVKSSCIQTSRPQPGLTTDLEILFDRLFEELVL
ncbi:DUF3037 domain-containing protein [Myroides pelagicus]|uniref:DUF3037 domain-containing protein n=1 Tax=Myroides pelagicus TaxID=270914 RepID=A0A7K1GIB0_9FLAO|nr:DUF3037 domain-containing protein [Myroides pelagicus]MEC4114150.1 DUF3037 domain-containing protein [Myroides pelagicus]MTH28510.1 DUF3037 domain-containing protein [Myroides pelagicus]